MKPLELVDFKKGTKIPSHISNAINVDNVRIGDSLFILVSGKWKQN